MSQVTLTRRAQWAVKPCPCPGVNTCSLPPREESQEGEAPGPWTCLYAVHTMHTVHIGNPQALPNAICYKGGESSLAAPGHPPCVPAVKSCSTADQPWSTPVQLDSTAPNLIDAPSKCAVRARFSLHLRRVEELRRDKRSFEGGVDSLVATRHAFKQSSTWRAPVPRLWGEPWRRVPAVIQIGSRLRRHIRTKWVSKKECDISRGLNMVS